MSKFILVPLGALLLANEAVAWWDSGHYLTACIARQTLITNGRQDVVDAAEKLAALYDDSQGVLNDLCRAATWMDWAKIYSLNDFSHPSENDTLPAISGFGSLHYIDFLTTGLHNGPTEADINDFIKNATNVHLGNLLSSAMQMTPSTAGTKLGDFYGTVWAMNLQLRWLLHLFSDAHQPMHMTAMYVNEPNYFVCDGTKVPVESNDAGGNGINVTLAADVDADLKANNPVNLHQLWDSMGGYDVGLAKEVTNEVMYDKAKELIANYPMATAVKEGWKLKQLNLRDDVYKPSAWLAAYGVGAPFDHKFAYQDVKIPENYCPSEFTWKQKTDCCKPFVVTKAHGQWVKEVSKKMVAIGGYRLADVLERWFDGMSPRLAGDLEREYTRQYTSGASNLIVGSAAAAIGVGALLY